MALLSALERELEYFNSKYDELNRQYSDCYIAMKGGEVLASGERKVEVVRKVQAQGHEVGTFLVRLISDKPRITQRFYSRLS